MLTARWMFSSSLVELRRARRAHRDHAVDRMPVQREAHFQAGGRHAAADLGDGMRGESRVARVLALRRIHEEAILADREPARLDARTDHLVRGARVRRALERYDLAGAQVGRERVDRAGDERQVGLAVAPERRRHADDDGVGLGRLGEVRRGPEAPGALVQLRDAGDVRDVAAPVPQRVDLFRVDVHAQHAVAHLREAQQQGQSDVSQADDRDRGLAAAQPVQQPLPGRRLRAAKGRRGLDGALGHAGAQRVIHERERTVMTA